jgi:hypothetical protein
MEPPNLSEVLLTLCGCLEEKPIGDFYKVLLRRKEGGVMG